MKFYGYERPHGLVGLRNYVAVMAPEICVSRVASQIAQEVRGTVAVVHKQGVGNYKTDLERIARTLAGLGRNPNVAGVLLVGLGCDCITVLPLAEEVARSGKPVEVVFVDQAGGIYGAIAKGIGLAQRLVQYASEIPRTPCEAASLIVGLNCAGSDATSALAANAAAGAAVDHLIQDGGTAILGEVPEMIGAEHILAQRAARPEVAERILKLVRQQEDAIAATGLDLRGTEPVRGNILGGLTTLEEKSLGSIIKGGTSPIQGVLEYGERPPAKGLFLMNAPALSDPLFTGLCAAGAQMILNTCGSTIENMAPVSVGVDYVFPLAPVVKITSSTRYYESLENTHDINAGTIVEGKETVEEVGQTLYQEMLRVASGKVTRCETLNYPGPISIHTLLPVL